MAAPAGAMPPAGAGAAWSGEDQGVPRPTSTRVLNDVRAALDTLYMIQRVGLLLIRAVG